MKVTKKDILTPLAVTAGSLFMTDTLARMFYFYWTIWWMDVINHLIGGMVVTFFFLLFPYVRKGPPLHVFLKLLFIVLVIGALWEIFESIFGLTNVVEIGYTIDTTIDMIMDVLGMVIAYVYLTKKLKIRFLYNED